MDTMFDALMTSLDEVESYLAGERKGYEVYVPTEIDSKEVLPPQGAEE